MDRNQFEELMDAYFDGESDVELEPALRASAEFRRLFVERSILNAHLYHSFTHSKGAVVARPIRLWPALAWAAVLIAMLAGGWWVFTDARIETTERPLVRELSDGSRVSLSPFSAATLGSRRAAVERGKAVFTVREGEKHFEIQTPAGPVTIRAGEVSIEIANEEESMNTWMVIVAVAAGSAEVRTPHNAVVLTPGMNRVYAAAQDEKKKDSEYTLHLKGKVTAVNDDTITITRPATSKQEETSFTFKLAEVPIKNGPAKVGQAAAVFYGQDGEAAYILIAAQDGAEAKKKPSPDKKKDPEPKKKPGGDPSTKVVKGKITAVHGDVIVVNDELKVNLKDAKVDGPDPQVGYAVAVIYGSNGEVQSVHIVAPSGDGEKKPAPKDKEKSSDPANVTKGKITAVDGAVIVVNDSIKIDLKEVKFDGAKPQVGFIAVVTYDKNGDVGAVSIHDPGAGGEKKPVEKKGEPAKKEPVKEGLTPTIKGKIVDFNKEKQIVTIHDGENKHIVSLDGLKIDGELTIGVIAVVYSGPEGDAVLIRANFEEKNPDEKKAPDKSAPEKKAPSKSKD
jgi:hypothetical protein